MKRSRGENPSYTKWRRSWGIVDTGWEIWPYRPMKKAGARRKRIRVAIAQANTRIRAQTGVDAHITWSRDERTGLPQRAPSAATVEAMAQMITVAYKHFAASADYSARQLRPGMWQHTFTYPNPFGGRSGHSDFL